MVAICQNKEVVYSNQFHEFFFFFKVRIGATFHVFIAYTKTREKRFPQVCVSKMIMLKNHQMSATKTQKTRKYISNQNTDIVFKKTLKLLRLYRSQRVVYCVLYECFSFSISLQKKIIIKNHTIT